MDNAGNNISAAVERQREGRSGYRHHRRWRRFNDYHLWKHKLRENCYKRVRENRTHLLWKMRKQLTQTATTDDSLNLNHEQDFVRSTFQDIVSDELKKISCSSPNEHFETLNDGDGVLVNDSLWEYDGLQEAYQGECEEILLEMQRIFYEDLREEPVHKESERRIATWEDEEDEYLAEAVYKHMVLEEKQESKKETWCPICKQGELLENSRIIYCTLCDLKINKSYEVNLDTLISRLGDAHIEHLDRGCRLKPKFCVETRFGLTALYIVCEPCGTFEVIV